MTRPWTTWEVCNGFLVSLVQRLGLALNYEMKSECWSSSNQEMIISDDKALDHLRSPQWIFSLTCLEVKISIKLWNEIWMSKLISAWFVMCKWCRCLARCVNGMESGCKGAKIEPSAMGGIKNLVSSFIFKLQK
jgi:hypothetical protein